MSERADDVAVVILAGGAATRLPEKLALDAGGVPLLVRVYRNVSAGRATYLSRNGPLADALVELKGVPSVRDRWTARGPLAGLLSAMHEIGAPWVFAVAGDAPFLDAAFIDRLAASIEPGLEAIVPYRPAATGIHIEPLAALYLRSAFLREGLRLLDSGDASLHGVIEKLKTRRVLIEDERIFTNINTPSDYENVRRALH